MAVGYTFEWDPQKARENRRKHDVSFEEATDVFLDPAAKSIYDLEHSSPGEDRWITLAAARGVVLVVVHTFTESNPDEVVIRIISARPATRRETRQYEEEA